MIVEIKNGVFIDLVIGQSSWVGTARERHFCELSDTGQFQHIRKIGSLLHLAFGSQLRERQRFDRIQRDIKGGAVCLDDLEQGIASRGFPTGGFSIGLRSGWCGGAGGKHENRQQNEDNDLLHDLFNRHHHVGRLDHSVSLHAFFKTKTLNRRIGDDGNDLGAAGLPERLVLAVDGAASADRTTSLGLATAAVVGIDLVAVGAALGTPMVVLADAAAHLGLRDGIEVLVASDHREADRLAGRLAADVDQAAALSRRVRAFAEHHLDLAVPARTLRRRLGLASTPSLVLRRLEELGTPPGSRVRARVRDVLGPFPLTLEVSP